MYWLFTTAPQAIAALVGIIFTGMFFMAESIDNRVRADQSLTEIAEAAKTALYKSMRAVAVLAAITILYDLFLVAFVSELADKDCCWTGWLIIIFAALNISTIYLVLLYVFQAVSPNYFDKIAANLSRKYKTGEVDSQEFINHFIAFERAIAANLSRKYKTGEVDSQEFINHFIAFERAVRNIPFIQQMNDQYAPIPMIIRMLVSHEIIDRDEAGQMFEINKIRNLIVHGEPIERVDRKIDDTLQEITNKVIEATQGRQ